ADVGDGIALWRLRQVAQERQEIERLVERCGEIGDAVACLRRVDRRDRREGTEVIEAGQGGAELVAEVVGGRGREAPEGLAAALPDRLVASPPASGEEQLDVVAQADGVAVTEQRGDGDPP